MRVFPGFRLKLGLCKLCKQTRLTEGVKLLRCQDSEPKKHFHKAVLASYDVKKQVVHKKHLFVVKVYIYIYTP